jgi:hypothetical protein
MAKTSMLCPFSGKMCKECETYRGRHYFFCYVEKYRGFIKQSNKEAQASFSSPHQINFDALSKKVNPWTSASNTLGAEPEIILNVLDMETKKVRTCTIAEAKSWDWSNPRTIRVIDGRHITSWHSLCDILKYRAGKGQREVELHEGPFFMLISGG